MKLFAHAILCLVFLSVSIWTTTPVQAATAPRAPRVEQVASSVVAPLWSLRPVQLGDSLRVADDPMMRWGMRLVSETNPEVAAEMGSARDLADDLVRAKVKLRRANRAIGWGLAGLIMGPLTLGLGVIFLLTIVGILLGVVFIVAGTIWTVGSLPVFIIGLVNKGVAKHRIDELETRLDLKGEMHRPLPEPRSLLTLRVAF